MGVRVGNWLTAEQGKQLLNAAGSETLRSKRNGAMLSLLIGCGLRRAELLNLTMSSIQLREEHWVIADLVGKEYGLHNWNTLKQRIAAHSAAKAIDAAIRADDRDAAVQLIQSNPQLLHIPVWSGNWGPPMSHAANLGRLEIIKAMAALGAKDFQHAFDRAVLRKMRARACENSSTGPKNRVGTKLAM